MSTMYNLKIRTFLNVSKNIFYSLHEVRWYSVLSKSAQRKPNIVYATNKQLQFQYYTLNNTSYSMYKCTLYDKLSILKKTSIVNSFFINCRTVSNKSKNERVQFKSKKKSRKAEIQDSEVVKRSNLSYTAEPHDFHSFDPGLSLPLSPSIKKRKPDWQVAAYATADEYNLEDLLKGFNKLKLYARSELHIAGRTKSVRLNAPASFSATPFREGSTGNFATQPQQGYNLHVEGYDQDNVIQEQDFIPGLSEVLHVTGVYKVEPEEREIFFFKDGSVVFWNFNELERRNVLEFLKQYSVGHVDSATIEEQREILPYTYTEGKTKLAGNKIFLNESQANDVQRYTFSNALSMSVKLGVWEADLDQYIDSIENVAEELEQSGRIILREKEILQKLGEMFRLRHQLSLSSDLLDVPDYYWDREHLEVLYRQTVRDLSIAKRTEVMNTKLNFCVEFLQLLKSDSGEKHGHKLEIAIIVLIFVEILLAIVHHS